MNNDTEIVLHNLKINNESYGSLYYDIILEQLCFKDKNNKITTIVSNNRSITINKNKLQFDNIKDLGYTQGPRGKRGYGLTYRKKWTHNKKYKKNDITIFNNCLYICLNNIYDTKISPDNDSDNWDCLFSNNFVFRGNWANNISYSVNEMVRDPIDNNIYIAIKIIKNSMELPHLSDKWISLIGCTKDTNFKNEWSCDNHYIKGNIVIEDNNLYKCNGNITDDILPPSKDIINWISLNGTFKNVWVANISYYQNDLVEFNGNIYKALIDINKNDLLPPLNNSWKLLETFKQNNTLFKKEWTKGMYYKTNDIIDYLGNIYICMSSILSNDIPPKDIDNWNLLFTNKIDFRGEWDNSVEYEKNNIVTYGGSVYISNAKNIHQVPSIENCWNLLLQNNSRCVFYSLCVNNLCCINFLKNGESEINCDSCENNHTIEDTNVYDYLYFKYDNNARLFPINLGYINQTHNIYGYNFETTEILIQDPGFYKIIYNIVYNGDVSELTGCVSVTMNNKTSELITSVKKCFNSDDKEHHINHTFFCRLRNICSLRLLVKFKENDNGKHVYVHPIKTWLCIEKN